MRPAWWARSALRLAMLLMPRGDVRQRYRRELEAELWVTDPDNLVATVRGIVTHAPALSRAVRDGRERRALRCRLGLHRYVVRRTDDNQPYRRCDRCGRDDPRVPIDPKQLGFGIAASSGGGWNAL